MIISSKTNYNGNLTEENISYKKHQLKMYRCTCVSNLKNQDYHCYSIKRILVGIVEHLRVGSEFLSQINKTYMCKINWEGDKKK